MSYPGEAALLVQEVQDAQGLLLDQVQHVLVVHKVDVAPVDGLLLILPLRRRPSVTSQAGARKPQNSARKPALKFLEWVQAPTSANVPAMRF